jgi:hypothetical protein
MKEDLIFKTNASFNSVAYIEDAENWHFYFSDNIYASSCGLWRLRKSKRIIYVSSDHQQKFGLPKPLDLLEKITEKLFEKKLLEIRVNKDSGDLTLLISEDYELEILITSSGYESYDFSIEGRRYIGLGSGDVGLVEAADHQNIYSCKVL